MKYPDGKIYEGGWKNGKFHGEGVYTNTEGVQKRGEWRNGIKQK